MQYNLLLLIIERLNLLDQPVLSIDCKVDEAFEISSLPFKQNDEQGHCLDVVFREFSVLKRDEVKTLFSTFQNELLILLSATI